MARRVGEPVVVKVRAEGEASAAHPAGAPTSFLWRGRLWKVRAVVAHWVETGPWWQGSGAGAGQDASPGTADTALANAAAAQGTVDTALANSATAQGTADTALANAAMAFWVHGRWRVWQAARIAQVAQVAS